MLYLVHENNGGEPVGVWNEAGDSQYKPDANYFRTRGRRAMENRPEHGDWAKYAAGLATSFNPNDSWQTHDLPEAPLQDVLGQVIRETRYADPAN